MDGQQLGDCDGDEDDVMIPMILTMTIIGAFSMDRMTIFWFLLLLRIMLMILRVIRSISKTPTIRSMGTYLPLPVC